MQGELERHRPRLWGLCYGITGSASDAEDLVQETFVRALERPPADASRDLSPWLVTVAANLSRDALRRRKRTAYVGPWLPDPVDDLPVITEAADAGLEARYATIERLGYAFLVALEVLTPNQRAVLVLRDVFDLSTEEAASALDLSVASVKVTLHRARRALSAHQASAHDRAPPDVAALAVHRFAIGLVAGDLAAVLAALQDDVTVVTDGGGEFHAALKVVRGADAVARLHLGLHKRRFGGGEVGQVTMRPIGGLVAVIATMPPGIPRDATRSVLLFDVACDGRIRSIATVLATRKLGRVRFEP